MTPIDRFERHLPDRLTELADPHVPDYFDDLLAQTARSRQRPAWTFNERWIPMALLTQSEARVRPLRQTWQLLVVVAVTLALVAGLAVVGARLLLPPSPDRGFNALVTVPTLELSDTWDTTTIDGLSGPGFMDVGPDGNLYVVNAGNSEILVLDPAGTVIGRWGTKGAGEGQFDFQKDAADPDSAGGGLAVGTDGSIYVADSVNDRVQQFTADGGFVRQWGGFGPANGQFLSPFDVATGPTGDVFVVDDRRNDVQRFAADGTWLATVGGQGTGDGQMNNTGGVDIDDAGMLINADYGGHKIQAWDNDGVFLWSDATGVEAGPVSEPLDVAAAPDGTFYVSDGAGIHVLGADRTRLSSWSPPDGDGSDTPYTVTVAADGTAYVASPLHDVIYHLVVGQAEVDTTPAPSPDTDASLASSPTALSSASPMPGITTVEFGSDSVFPVPFTLDLPARWAANGDARGYVDTVLKRSEGNTPAYVTVFVPLNAFADPCQAGDGPMAPPVGPTVEQLTEALTTAVGMRAGPVQDVVIDGFRGKRFALDNSIDIRSCSDPTWLPQWTFDSARSGPVVEEKASALPGSEQLITILDVGGTRVLILGWLIDSTVDEVAETQQVMDSIDFQ